MLGVTDLARRSIAGCATSRCPYVPDVLAATAIDVHLAVRDDLEALYAGRLHGNRAVPVVRGTGTRLLLLATAVGNALLADAAPGVLDRAPGPVRSRRTLAPGPGCCGRGLRRSPRPMRLRPIMHRVLAACRRPLLTELPTEPAAPFGTQAHEPDRASGRRSAAYGQPTRTDS